MCPFTQWCFSLEENSWPITRVYFTWRYRAVGLFDVYLTFSLSCVNSLILLTISTCFRPGSRRLCRPISSKPREQRGKKLSYVAQQSVSTSQTHFCACDTLYYKLSSHFSSILQLSSLSYICSFFFYIVSA